MKIKYYQWNDGEIKNILADHFIDKTLVPVIGSGFTRGCATKGGGVVPSGEDLRLQMINEILDLADGRVNHGELKDKEFSFIADLYFGGAIVPEDNVKRKLKTSFQNVD